MLHIIFPKYDTKDLLSVLRANFMLATINWPWAIILCRFSDVTFSTKNIDYYEDLFTRNGTGGLCDYWRTV